MFYSGGLQLSVWSLGSHPWKRTTKDSQFWGVGPEEVVPRALERLGHEWGPPASATQSVLWERAGDVLPPGGCVFPSLNT